MIGRNKQRGVLRPEHERDRLAAKPVLSWLVVRPGGEGPVEETHLLKHPDGSPHPSLGEPEVPMVSERAAINREGAGATVADMLRSVLPAELEPAVAGRMAPRRLGTLDDIAKVVALVASNDGRSRRIAASFNRLRATLSELRGYFR